MSKDSLEIYSFDVDETLNVVNSLFPDQPWKHTSARKAHVDLFGEVIRNGDVYYRQQVGAGWGDVVRLSRLSMERLIMSFSTPTLYCRELPSN